MKLELTFAEEFGSHLADGGAAAAFRQTRIDPYLGLCREIVLDFTGVRHANSSFINALIAGIVEQHGSGVLKILVFKGCNPVLRVLVEGAIALGLQKSEDHIGA
ncbi:MAG: STAS-like domain-containing protein [Opitutaceae bacterium]|nr:STAS-like domain-containing protein [Opitutaceae bacterium]